MKDDANNTFSSDVLETAGNIQKHKEAGFKDPVHNEKMIGIQKAVTAMLDLGIEDEEIVRMLLKHWNLQESEAESLLDHCFHPMRLDIKNDCPKIKSQDREYWQTICGFHKNAEQQAIQEVTKYNYIDKQNKSKKLWALFGQDTSDENWICLEVGSSDNIKAEIRGNLRMMIEKPQKTWKDSEFYKNKQLFRFWTYSDRVSCKYRAIYDMCEKFTWYEIDVDKYLKDVKSRNKDVDIEGKNPINFAEVYFAYEMKALFWNPSPAIYGNQEKVILNELRR